MARRIRTAARKKAVQARARATVDAILRATAHILVKDGYDRASTNKIALRAGVSIGSLYQYFPSKEALVAALMDKHMEEMADVLRAEFARLATLPLERAAEDIVRLMVAAHAVDPKLHKVLVEQVPRIGMLEQAEILEREMAMLVRAYLESKRGEIVVADLDLGAFIVMGIVEALTHIAVLKRPDLLGESFVREVSAAVVRYLRGSAAAPVRSHAATPRVSPA
jgi:AcrR family transcriptional regulator